MLCGSLRVEICEFVTGGKLTWIEARSPTLQGDSLPSEPPREHFHHFQKHIPSYKQIHLQCLLCHNYHENGLAKIYSTNSK